MTINVINRLTEETSIHWHGIMVPSRMDGVPMVEFRRHQARRNLQLQLQVRQAGTYWYHSHSGGQEQEGLYAPIVIEPAKASATRSRATTS